MERFQKINIRDHFRWKKFKKKTEIFGNFEYFFLLVLKFKQANGLNIQNNKRKT